MTIRECVKSRGERALTSMLLLLALAPVAAFALRLVSAPPQLSGMVAMMIIVFAGVRFSIRARTQCPRCQANLSREVGRSMVGLRIVDKCPHCGVSLDEPMGAANSK